MKLRTALLGGIGSILIAALAAQAQVPGVNSTLASVFTLAYDNSTMKPTYSATAQVTLAANATDVCVLSGSATKTIKVRRVLFGGIATTAVTDPVAVIKRSTINTGGTTVAMTKVPYDSNSAAASALYADIYSANGTLGTAVGTLTDPYVSFGNLTTGGAQLIASGVVFGQLGSPVVLRGIGQSVALNMNGGNYSGGLITCTFEWTEDNDS